LALFTDKLNDIKEKNTLVKRIRDFKGSP